MSTLAELLSADLGEEGLSDDDGSYDPEDDDFDEMQGAVIDGAVQP